MQFILRIFSAMLDEITQYTLTVRVLEVEHIVLHIIHLVSSDVG